MRLGRRGLSRLRLRRGGRCLRAGWRRLSRLFTRSLLWTGARLFARLLTGLFTRLLAGSLLRPRRLSLSRLLLLTRLLLLSRRLLGPRNFGFRLVLPGGLGSFSLWSLWLGRGRGRRRVVMGWWGVVRRRSSVWGSSVVVRSRLAEAGSWSLRARAALRGLLCLRPSKRPCP